MRDSICNDCVKRTRCDMAEIGRSPLAISTCYGYEKGNPTNADLIRNADTEIEMVDIILKLVKKIPEGENKRRTLYQLLEQEVQDG